MKALSFALLIALLTGCATRSPAPPGCEGDLTPINASSATHTPGANDAARPRS
jgi:hypothetical protein